MPGGWIALAVTALVAVAALTLVVRQIEPALAFFPTRGEDSTPRDHGVPFHADTISTADGERLRLWHLAHDAPLARVVYFHGNGGNLSMWTPILTGLHAHGFDVVAIDYRGYGLSTGRPTESGLYRDVDATMDYIRERMPAIDAPLIFWGRSLGTVMAAYAAARHPPRGIILEAGFPHARSVLETNPLLWTLSWLSSYRFATARHMANVHVPALVVHGDRDGVIPHRLGKRLYSALNEPKQFVSIRGGDHNDATPADPAAYWSAVRRFAASLRSSP